MRVLEDRIEFIREALPKGGKGVELGVWQADHALQLLEYAQPEHLWLIDAWSRECEPGIRAELLEQVYARVNALFAGDERVTVWRARTDEGMARIEDGSLDWVYIDAGHSYEAVLRDLLLCWPKLKPGSVLAGHDYHRDYSHFGVIEAVDEFLAEHGMELEYTSRDRFVDWSARVIKNAEESKSVADRDGGVQKEGSQFLQEGFSGGEMPQ